MRHLRFIGLAASTLAVLTGCGQLPAATLAGQQGLDAFGALADLAGIVNPIRAVNFMKCWNDPPTATTVSTPATLVSPPPAISGGRRAR